MKSKQSIIFFVLTVIMVIAHSCNIHSKSETGSEQPAAESTSDLLTSVSLTQQQFEKLDIHLDTLSKNLFSSYIETNGELSSLPQDQAAVTAVIGANVVSINAYEGQQVQKGQTLAYLSHPDLLDLQTKYVDTYNQLQYIEKEFQRQNNMFTQDIGSGKELQKVESEYNSLKYQVKSLETQLILLNMSPEKIRGGHLYQQIPVISPINGYIENIDAKIGQYVEPQKQMFSIVNNNNIFADLMVYEKDISKVKVGQRIQVSIQSMPDKIITSKVFSVGKIFESEQKAVHIHALIDNKYNLISGMYIKGKIFVDSCMTYTIHDGGIIESNDRSYIFTASRNNDVWKFEPIEITKGREKNGIVEIELKTSVTKGTQIVQDNAYYIISEIKKSETGEED